MLQRRKLNRILWTTIVVVIALMGILLTAGLVLAGSDSPLPTPSAPTPTPAITFPWTDTPPTPQEFLGWLALGGAPLIGALTALLERKAKWFQKLTSGAKWWVSFALGAGLPALAGLLLLYVPAPFWDAITPVWTILGTAILGYLGKEAAYLWLVKPNQRTWLVADDLDPADVP